MATVAEVLALGLDHHRAGRHDRAERAYRGVLAFDPDQPDARHLLGVLAHERGQHDAAVELIARAVALDGTKAEYRRNLVRVLAAAGQRAAAAEAAWRALAIVPDDPWLHHVQARLRRDAGDGAAARALLDLAVALKPDYAEAWFDLGVLARFAGSAVEAIAHFRRAVHDNPDLVEGWFNLGCGLMLLGEAAEGVTILARVVDMPGADPDLVASARVEIGKARFADGDVAGAIAAYREAARLRPDDPEAALLLVQSRYLTADCTPAAYLAERRDWARRFALKRDAALPPHGNDRDPGRRLRIGYVGGNQLNGNTAAVTILPMIEAHDRGAIELVLYSDLPDWGEDDYTRRYRAAAALWRDTRTLDDRALAAQIRSDRIDVLVDVFGHMSGMRFMVWGARPSPVQIAAIVTGTTGQDAFDAVVADPILLPPALEDTVAERVMRVPLAYLYHPAFDLPALTAPPARGHVTFGSFNQLAKLSAPCLAAWARILTQMPTARLMIKGRGFADPAVGARFESVFATHGVAADRLDLRPWADDFADHLAAFNDCDVALDSFPYNGVTTTCEALAMGLPVVTLAGDRIAGRYGAALLTAVGLEDGIARDEASYVERALALAGDAERRARLRRDLRAHLMASALADARALAGALEGVYRLAWQRWVHADHR
jgi:predicted O-linked N-acetylglucosamine transferase (SPINDLY family)